MLSELKLPIRHPKQHETHPKHVTSCLARRRTNRFRKKWAKTTQGETFWHSGHPQACPPHRRSVLEISCNEQATLCFHLLKPPGKKYIIISSSDRFPLKPGFLFLKEKQQIVSKWRIADFRGNPFMAPVAFLPPKRRAKKARSVRAPTKRGAWFLFFFFFSGG